MWQFQGDVALMLEIFAIAGGLVLWHRAKKDPDGKLLKAAAVVLLTGGVLVGLCTLYYWMRALLGGAS